MLGRLYLLKYRAGKERQDAAERVTSWLQKRIFLDAKDELQSIGSGNGSIPDNASWLIPFQSFSSCIQEPRLVL